MIEINDFVTLGHTFLNCEWTVKTKVYRDIFKKDISVWIYVKIRYENFHCSVIVVNMKEDRALLEKTIEDSKGRPSVVCAMCPRI